MSINELANKYGSDKGTNFSFANGYASHYDEIFSPLKNKLINILEIGLVLENTTAPIKIWQDYFPLSNVHGFDIQDCKNIENEQTKFFQGDQRNTNDLRAAVDYFNVGFDIIIDDGIHTSEAQQKSLGVLFPYLNKDGFYIVEDVSLPEIKHPIVSCEHSFITLQHLILHKKLHTPFMSDDQKLYIEEELHGGYFILNQKNDLSTFILRK